MGHGLAHGYPQSQGMSPEGGSRNKRIAAANREAVLDLTDGTWDMWAHDALVEAREDDFDTGGTYTFTPPVPGYYLMTYNGGHKPVNTYVTACMGLRQASNEWISIRCGRTAATVIEQSQSGIGLHNLTSGETAQLGNSVSAGDHDLSSGAQDGLNAIQAHMVWPKGGPEFATKKKQPHGLAQKRQLHYALITHGNDESYNGAVEIDFDTDVYDPYSMHDAVTEEGRFHIKQPGIYLVWMQGYWTSNTDYFGHTINLFDETDAAVGTNWKARNLRNHSNGVANIGMCAAIAYAEAGWYFKFDSNTGIATTLNSDGGTAETHAGIAQLAHGHGAYYTDNAYHGLHDTDILGICDAQRTSNLAVSANTWTDVGMDQDNIDTHSWHDAAGTNDRFIANAAGIYLFGGSFYAATGASGNYVQYGVDVNDSGTMIARTIEYTNVSASGATSILGLASLSANDYLTPNIYLNTSAGTLSGSATNKYATFWMMRIQ